DYVEPHTPLLTLITHHRSLQPQRFLHSFFITNDQQSIQHLKLPIQKLTQIPLTPISPPINHPQTAINSIQHLTQLFIK
ncbi:DUF2254 family protein, partial [Priestia megaterium]|uniref:DUF2254 family protein n=1 Tax=Priestia megaterium TaxID=1404 RepID=UPI0012B6FEAB